MSINTCKKNVGEVVNEGISAKFLWKIQKYSSLPRDIDHCVESPLFKFLDATWFIRLYLNGQSLSKGWVGLYMLKMCSKAPIKSIVFTLKILKNDDSDYISMEKECSFREAESGWGSPKLLQQNHLLSDIAQIVRKDTLRILCFLRVGQAEIIGESISIRGINECVQKDPETSGNLADAVDKMSVLSKPSGFDKVSEDFENLLVSEEDSDLLVRVKGQDFKVHRAILKARSPVFKAMFRCDMAEGKSGIVDIVDCDPVAFRDFLLFLYCGRVKGLSEDTVFDLYSTADKYDVKNLKLKCISFLMDNTSVDNFCDVITLALKHDESELIEKTTNFFVEHGTKIILTAKWLSFMKENLVVANELYIKAMAVPKA